jgi:hypothetical protein
MKLPLPSKKKREGEKKKKKEAEICTKERISKLRHLATIP